MRNGNPTISLLLLLAVLLLGNGCKKKEGCTDPASTTYDAEAQVDDGSCQYPQPQLSLRFHHQVNGLPYSTATTYQDGTGRSFQFTKARFYFSSPKVLTDTGAIPSESNLHVTADQSEYLIGDIDPGHYEGVSFQVGLDSAINHSDPTLYPEGHALSITSPIQDHWTWNVGYVFLRIEGMVDSTSAMNGPLNVRFDYHVATDALLRTVTLSKPFDVARGVDFAFDITIDWASPLQNVLLYRDRTHTTDNFPLAERIMNNFVAGISAD